MKDFTQIKLINSLVDVVERFYDKKDQLSKDESYHLKGFCEGLAFALLQQNALNEDEVERILKGYGKRIDSSLVDDGEEKSITKIDSSPATTSSIVNKNTSSLKDMLKKEIDELENIKDEIPREIESDEDEIAKLNQSFQHQVVMNTPKNYENLDIPTFKRKKG